ncbi:hypothetical protein [Nocardioides ochotonae]|uniref:hypothetical protein n=1 Tax=Nocardioides ochotonae TaxID=2685869 RepID=UPI00140AD475|nr:hypothetical protein [Nocardioides ochotonae]
MKKLIAGLFAAILTTAGLVAVSSAPAQAANCKAGTYDCVKVKVQAKKPKGPVRVNKPVKVKVPVSTVGNIQAKGTLKVTITGPKGFKKTITVKVTKSKDFNVNLGKLKRAGTYKVRVSFKGAKGFSNAQGKTVIKVKAKKKNKK